MKHKQWKFIYLLMLAVFLGACSEEVTKKEEYPNNESASDEPKHGGTYTIATAADPDMLDPHRSSSIYTHDYMGLVYNKLVTYETGQDVHYTENNIIGDLAKEWEISEDGKVYTFLLREAYWHDIEPVNGRKVVAQDVIATMNRIMTLPGHQVDLLQEVEKIEAKDDTTVEFTLKKPLMPFLSFLANHFMWILPQEAVDGEVDLTTTAIGTGPFILEEWDNNVSATFGKNPNFFEEDKPYIDKVEYVINPDVDAQVLAFQKGEVDAITMASPQDIETILEANSDTVINEGLIPTQIQVAMNMEREPFEELSVRKAISMAIDRKEAVEHIFGGGEVSAPVNPHLSRWTLPKEEREKLQPFAQEKAKKMLAEAGYADGFDTTILTTNAYGEQLVKMAEWVVEDLRKIGINAELEVVEYTTFYTEKYPDKDYDIIVSYQTYFQEADEWLRTQLLSDSPRNWFGVTDSDLDKMLNEQRVILDEEERKKKVHDIQRYVLEDVVNPIPLVTNTVFSPRHPSVKNYYPHASYGNIHMKDVWIDKE